MQRFAVLFVVLNLCFGCGSPSDTPSVNGSGDISSQPDPESEGSDPSTAGSPALDPKNDAPLLPPEEEPSVAPPSNGSQTIEALRLEPEDAVLELVLPGAATLPYRAWARMKGNPQEVDITEDTVFSVRGNWQVGQFPEFKNVFENNTLLPRGGAVTVHADAKSAEGTIVSAETELLVKLRVEANDPRPSVTLPANVNEIFTLATASGDNPTKEAPVLVYPNNGTLLPPNLSRLELHFSPGDGELFELHLGATSLDQTYTLACGEAVNGGCVFELDREGYRLLADSARGESVTVTLRATDGAGTFVKRAESTFAFADTDVLGAVYYWTVTAPTAIMRFDFGSIQEAPEVFLTPGQNGVPNKCVGCHTLSRDGSKLVASLGGQNDGRQVFVNDLSRSVDDPEFLQKAGDAENRIQFASFNPDATRFVAIYGDADAPLRNMLWFHDGETGDRVAEESFELDFEPDHPEWSPNGAMIAMTHVGVHRTSQRPANSGIDVIRRQSGVTWSSPEVLVPIETDKNRFNPSFAPDSSFLVFSESTCPAGKPMSARCDADDDPTSTTWATLPESGAARVHLARAAAGGKLDATTELSDTFPRSSPFKGNYQGSTIFWVTVSSRRTAGQRNPGQEKQLLWMFAVDRDKVLAGEDGSYPAFFLPFQDLGTSNHIAQWTERIVSDDPPPVPPVPEPPAAPPEPDPPRVK